MLFIFVPSNVFALIAFKCGGNVTSERDVNENAYSRMVVTESGMLIVVMYFDE